VPVAELYVEGDLDRELLNAALGCVPMKRNWTVKRGGPKGSLGPQARRARGEGRGAYYIRDRDFDFDPPATTSTPFEAEQDGERKTVLGWAWARHELESYLLEPALAMKALGWDAGEFSAEIAAAGRRLRHYQIARWVVGTSRRRLPPHHDLGTRPADLEGHEFRLPGSLEEGATQGWCRSHIGQFANDLHAVLSDAAVSASIAEASARLTENAVASCSGALTWCSGKDLLASLDGFVRARTIDGPNDYRRTVARWAVENPLEFLDVTPEWAAFLVLLDGR